jgi:hypothetical protein
MLEISVDPKVAQALKAAFPKPPNGSQRALNKYVATLTTMLMESLARGQTPMEAKLNLFSISLHDLANRAGQIGSNRMRVHAWLRDNNLALIDTVEIGSNLSGIVTKARLTDLVELRWIGHEPAADQSELDSQTQASLLAQSGDVSQAVFEHLYPELVGKDFASHDQSKFDIIDVDMQSLANYLQWLQMGSKHFNSTQINQYQYQARLILAVATHTNGKYLQRIKPSDFGRTYYAGTSIQNVNKELRRAILGNCWEYDIRSSVIAWKMGFAKEYVATHAPTQSVQSEFPATLSYLENKAGFMNTIQYLVFGSDSDLAENLQIKILKQAFTAISFGARKTAKGWMDSSGKWTNPAIVDIFRIKTERDQFLADPMVCAFIAEQGKLDQYLFDGFKTQRPDLLKLQYLQTQGGNPSRAKVIAFLYQHEETTVMDIVRKTLVEHGHAVLANIHDAIIVRKRLKVDVRHEIELRMQELTDNKYWRLGATELVRYSTANACTDKP